MKITPSQLKDFKKLYKSHFGKEIDDIEALTYGTSLINLMKLLLSNSKKLGE